MIVNKETAASTPRFDPDALFEASKQNDIKEFERLLKLDPRCFEKSRSDGITATHVAAQHGANEVLKRILKIDPMASDLRDEKGYSPFLRASECNQVSSLELLLSAKANSWKDRDDYGLNSLHRAARNGHVSVCAFILNLKQGGKLLHERDYHSGETPLFHACVVGNVQIVKLFLEHGANVNALNVFHANTLFPAIVAAVEVFGKPLEVVKLLIEYKCDVNLRSELKQTPLCLAIDLRCFPAIVILLQLGGANPDIPKEGEERHLFPTFTRLVKHPQEASPLSLALTLNDRDLIQAFEDGLGKERVDQRMFELSAVLDPFDLVGRHLLLLDSGERVFCVDAHRQFPLFGEIQHVVRSTADGREFIVVLQRPTMQHPHGMRFHVVSDSAFEFPLLTRDEQPANILAS